MSKNEQMQEHIDEYDKLIAEGYLHVEALEEIAGYVHPSTLARLIAALKKRGK